MTKHDEIADAVNALVERLKEPPIKFNWTPEMESIWPKEYRPTMSGLLAIWEALHGAAVYGRNAGDWTPVKLTESPSFPESADGWVPHNGHGVPLWWPRGQIIETRHRSGIEYTGKDAWPWDQWRTGAGFWTHDDSYNDITHWRYPR